MSDRLDDLPAELHGVARALRARRPEMDADAHARARLRALEGARGPSRPRRAGARAARAAGPGFAVAALLACGALLTTGGAALGLSALSTTTDASQAQYGPVPPPPVVPPRGDTDVGTSAPTLADPLAEPPDEGGVAGAGDEGTAAAQPARQLEGAGREALPFTGYAAIPLLLGGIALLVAGLVLRRRTRAAPLT